MTHDFTYDAAPYVLGALSPDERRDFEAHLAECPACEEQVAEFAGLPGLLSRLPADDLSAVLEGEDPSPPPELLPSLRFAVRRERRSRRWRTIAAGLAAASLVAVGTAVAVTQLDSTPGQSQTAPTLAFRQIRPVPVTASASLTAQPWGTAIDMRCTYGGKPWSDGKPRRYTLWAKDKAGNTQSIGAWTVLIGQEVPIRASTSIPRDQLRGLEVRNPANAPLLVLDL